MRKLFAKDLKIKFIETLNELDEFSYEEGNPFLIKIGTDKFFVFLKNLSQAYFKNSPDVTRVQLPYSNHFSKIVKSDIPFIILGYDIDTDTVVAWNPKKVKERLNAKSNVSLYSRTSLQENVKHDEFRFGYLSNGERIIIFKRKNLTFFFDGLLNFFEEDSSIDFVPLRSKKKFSVKERFELWLKSRDYSDRTVKHYSSGINKISRDLHEIYELKQKTLFEVESPNTLQQLFEKWYSVKEFKNNDNVGKLMYSNSFKRFIEFSESEQKPIQASAKKRINEQIEQKETATISEITDKELMQIIIPLMSKNKVLQAVDETSKYYEKKHKNMTFREWYKLVSELYKKMKT
jgi:hypothetical protein